MVADMNNSPVPFHNGHDEGIGAKNSLGMTLKHSADSLLNTNIMRGSKTMYKWRVDQLKISAEFSVILRKALLVALPLMLCEAAGAGANGVIATLAEPLAEKKEIIVDGNLFRCDGSTCALASHSSAAATVGICRSLQHKVGTLTGYVVEGRPFDDDKLARCNAH